MHRYLSNGYLNSLSNFNYKKDEKITSLRPLLDQNSSEHHESWSALLSSKQMSKSIIKILIRRNWWNVKLHYVVLLRLGLKGVEIYWNVSNISMYACSSNGNPNLCSNLNSKKLLKSETPSCSFDRVGLKGGQNSSKRRESWRACLSIQYASKHMIKFKF